MPVNRIRPPFPYYGGKQLIAGRVIALMPPHAHYVEPYAGSCAVLLAKPRITFETVNDVDKRLINLWRIIRERPDDLARACAMTPHSRAEHAHVLDTMSVEPDDDLELARRTFVLLTQGRSGGTSRRTGWRYFVNPACSTFSMPHYLAAYVSRIADVAARLAGVSLECRPALDVIASYGRHPQVLLYVDPPYLPSTRKSAGYSFEMTTEDHRALGAALRRCESAVVVSGYPSALYDQELFPDWNRAELAAGTGNGGCWRHRTEVLWSNRPFPARCPRARRRGQPDD